MAIAEQDLELLLLIRRFEEALLELFSRGELNGTTHTCLGQEYIPVALSGLTQNDFIFSNHRGHGHYLAHCRDPRGLLAEIMGREGAPCRGVGGSQHLFQGRFLSTGIQGQSLPVAAGVAMHFKRAGEDRLAVAYIGDGTWGQGVVYEALNMARLWQLPLLVAVENNGIAQTTPTRMHLAGTVEGRANAFGIDYQRIQSVDVDEIRKILAPRIERARRSVAPFIVEFETNRLGPHSKGDDNRSADEMTKLREQDWCMHYARLEPGMFGVVDRRQRARVAQIVEEVRQLPLATWEPDDAT